MDGIKEQAESVDFLSDQTAQGFAIELYPEAGVPQAADYAYYPTEAVYEVPPYYDLEGSLSQIEQGIDPCIIMGSKGIEPEQILNEQTHLVAASEGENHPFILPKMVEKSPDSWSIEVGNALRLEKKGGTRKLSHIASEQRRRAAMKDTFAELKSMLPPEKRSRSAVLHAGNALLTIRICSCRADRDAKCGYTEDQGKKRPLQIRKSRASKKVSPLSVMQ